MRHRHQHWPQQAQELGKAAGGVNRFKHLSSPPFPKMSTAQKAFASGSTTNLANLLPGKFHIVSLLNVFFVVYKVAWSFVDSSTIVAEVAVWKVHDLSFENHLSGSETEGRVCLAFSVGWPYWLFFPGRRRKVGRVAEFFFKGILMRYSFSNGMVCSYSKYSQSGDIECLLG